MFSVVQESRRATRESAKGGKARNQGGASTPSTPKVEGSAHGTPLHTPKRPPQRPPQTPAGRTARHNLPTKRTLDAAEDAEQRDQSQRTHTSSIHSFMSVSSVVPSVNGSKLRGAAKWAVSEMC